jgi:transposase
MDTDKNAALTPKGREMMVRVVMDFGLSKAAAARQFTTTPKTVAKWVDRFEAEGMEGLRDRSSRPLSSPSQTTPADCAAVETLRRQRHTGEQIAGEVGVSAATVSRILKRLGLNRLSALEPAEPVRRYERDAPGEILHIDIKKLGKFNRIGHRISGDRTGQSNTRGVGWEYVHLAIDDHSRLAYSEILPDEKRASCLRFLFNALRFFQSLGVKVQRVMTDNGVSFRSFRYAKALRRLRISICAPNPTRREPMAKPSASSKPACANGPMPAATTPPTSAPPSCPSGCTATTGIAPMAPSELNRQSADSPNPRTTCRGSTSRAGGSQTK